MNFTYTPKNKDQIDGVHVMPAIANGQFGVVAKEDIKRGRTLIESFPISTAETSQLNEQTYGLWARYLLKQHNKHIQRMHPRKRQKEDAKWYSAKNVDAKEVDLVLKIKRNHFLPPVVTTKKKGTVMLALYGFPSFVNHSDVPNAILSISPSDLYLQITAIKDIKKGEEITYCYFSSSDLIEDLRKAEFQCKCLYCVTGKEELREASQKETLDFVTQRRDSGQYCIFCLRWCPSDNSNCQPVCSVECHQLAMANFAVVE